MKKLALCVALAALATSAMANEHSTLGEGIAASPHQNDATLKTMLDHALSTSRKEDPSAQSAQHHFDFDWQPAR
ncbi:hypothetical protein [Paraburkholderia humisilvae]|uniref:Uncharacterized protein n=1 Tax=Paraburkholderia humisilvae TaxID=627669 RepID=A0A6J5F7G5_9BURK|nr:hypothetical protein [Paraburkholderia humisilvae]CAB3773552.1 hypothetical protein LMG29542_07306 [Paraburkholderia humisilvae]